MSLLTPYVEIESFNGYMHKEDNPYISRVNARIEKLLNAALSELLRSV